MKKILFVVKDKNSFQHEDYQKKHLPHVSISVSEVFPSNSDDYQLIVLWSYPKIIKNIENKTNVIVFHSSDLPEGKGWAPIYHTLAKNLKFYTITGVRTAKNADSGEIIVKARFPIQANYTAKILREFDNEICFILISKVLDKFPDGKLKGMSQNSKGTFYKKRNPEDNEVDSNAKLIEILPHLRACEKQHPAFFYHEGEKFYIHIEPENKPEFPPNLEIEFYDSTQQTKS